MNVDGSILYHLGKDCGCCCCCWWLLLLLLSLVVVMVVLHIILARITQLVTLVGVVDAGSCCCCCWWWRRQLLLLLLLLHHMFAHHIYLCIHSLVRSTILLICPVSSYLWHLQRNRCSPIDKNWINGKLVIAVFKNSIDNGMAIIFFSVENSGTRTAVMPGHATIRAYSNYFVVPDKTQHLGIMTAHYKALVERAL